MHTRPARPLRPALQFVDDDIALGAALHAGLEASRQQQCRRVVFDAMAFLVVPVREDVDSTVLATLEQFRLDTRHLDAPAVRASRSREPRPSHLARLAVRLPEEEPSPAGREGEQLRGGERAYELGVRCRRRPAGSDGEAEDKNRRESSPRLHR